MDGRHPSGWTKHADFMAIDLACMQLCFALAYWLVHGLHNPYGEPAYQYLALLITAGQIAVMLFAQNYSGILRRGPFSEFTAVAKHALETLAIVLMFLFLVQNTADISRLQTGFTFLFFLPVDWLARLANKERIRRFAPSRLKSLVVVATAPLARQVVEKLREDASGGYSITGVILYDGESTSELEDELGVVCVPIGEEAMHRIKSGWVDEVFVLQSDRMAPSRRFMNELAAMGVTVDYAVQAMGPEHWAASTVRELGGYQVLTSGMRLPTAGQAAAKRVMDVAGGLVGCLITGILCIFIAPAIKKASPGPVFYAQERVGRNGKTFKMYKFRSMYPDADERKKEFEDQNRIGDGMMFKLDYDPRVIGSEKTRPDGRPGGIGNFIRRTSIDEFPQFLNVLKGDMSLVGTRPSTLDEWVRYDLRHRARMSGRPGITGLWQVSGRSQITDFDEVVALDRKYIEEWSLLLDVKILLRTIAAVAKRKGAM